MRIIKGNLLHKTSGIIVHQVNNKRVMGAGLALQIKLRYPKHYDDYMKAKMILGRIVISCVSQELTVVGVIGQDGYGRNKRYTDYDALEEGFKRIALVREGEPVYIPYSIGCGLAGGDWEVVSKIIERHIPDAVLVKR